MRFTAETCPNVRVLEMQNFIPAYMRGWTYVGTYASRSIFSEPKFLLPIVLLYALFARARARPLLHLKKLQNRFGCDSQNHEAGIRRHYHGREDFYYLRHLRSTVRLLPPGPGFLKISLLHSQKYSIQWLVCISFKDGNTDTGINIPGYFLSQIKGIYKNVTLPPNIATRANTRGPILFQCCRVVLNKDKNRLELPKGEVVGKPVNRCKEDEKAEHKNTAVSFVDDMESYLIGKINIIYLFSVKLFWTFSDQPLL